MAPFCLSGHEKLACMHPPTPVLMPCHAPSTFFFGWLFRWLGSFPNGREAGMAYDAAAISQKGSKAKTNFQYLDFSSIPRKDAETEPKVRWDLLPKDIAEVRIS